jgi:N-acetylgalactosamine kinase
VIIGQQQISKWQNDINIRSTHLIDRLKTLYGNDLDILESRLPLYRQALQTFAETYGVDRDAIISRAPGRINLLGNHIDHRGGHCNYIAVNRETLLVASLRNDDRIVIHNALSDRFGPREFSISDLLPPKKRGQWLDYIETVDLVPRDWENYIRAAVLHVQDHFADTSLKGLDIAITGDIPIAAGLSSSSSLVVSTFEAFLHLNELEIPHLEKAEFCGRAEWYAGTRGGSGDHAALLYAESQSVVHLQFFPLTTKEVPFPAEYRVVACNSYVEHAPPGIFNERIATYEIGLMLVKEQSPQHADRLEHLRDLNANHLGISQADIYRILKTLPERMSRAAIRAALPKYQNRLDTLFSPHDEPKEGYRVRQVMLFGLAECARSAQCQHLLKSGDMESFGQLKYISHNGDRQFTFGPDGLESRQNNLIADADLENLIADLESNNSARISAAQLHNQPGGYDCSCQELDQLVDLASRVDGVVGAGLTGGGLGGCVLVFVRDEAVDTLIDTLEAQFYTPRGLSDAMLVCASVAGSGLI